MIRAVIFDMDGLLTDSESIGMVGIRECGRKQGVEFSDALIAQTIGATSDYSSALYRAHYPAIDTDRLYRDFADYMHGRARRGEIPLKKGAVELLALLREKKIPCAVASSSPMNTVELYLGQAGVLDYFQVFSTGGPDVKSKPAPDIFLRAAERLGVVPEDCLVLEDSVNGVKAGRAAGMTVCMVPDLKPYTKDLAPYCDYVKEDLLAVMPLVNI